MKGVEDIYAFDLHRLNQTDANYYDYRRHWIAIQMHATNKDKNFISSQARTHRRGTNLC